MSKEKKILENHARHDSTSEQVLDALNERFPGVHFQIQNFHLTPKGTNVADPDFEVLEGYSVITYVGNATEGVRKQMEELVDSFDTATYDYRFEHEG